MSTLVVNEQDLTITKQIIKQLITAWKGQNIAVTKFFNKYPDEAYMTEIAPGRNRAVYLLGHLLAVNDGLMPLLGIGEKFYPELEEIFLKNPDRFFADIPSIAELKQKWETVNIALAAHFESMRAEEWLSGHTRVSAEDFATDPTRNKLNVLISRTNHQSNHLGQLQVIKETESNEISRTNQLARIMIKKLTLFFLLLFVVVKSVAQQSELLQYHDIQTDKAGNIVPWFNPDPAIAFDHNLHIIWDFWYNMRHDPNGLPYYMNHQVWNKDIDDPRGIGGDQFMMAISSWRLLYAYTGDEHIKANAYFLAGYYLTHGLSPANCKWPDIPFPYNTLIYSGIYDGDMRNGKDVAQPDKAGSFGLELVHVYKIKSDPIFLDAAVKIANTLAANVQTGNADHSPLPFKVNVFTGKTVLLKVENTKPVSIDTAGYTTNLTPTLQLFFDLMELKKGNMAAYKNAADKILTWLKKYPIQNNKWGPFFEDVGEWSQTQINAMTCARYMMEHPQYFPEWKPQVKNIITWVHTNFNNEKWKKYGVTVTNEQSVYPVPGNSHSARQAADELLFGSLTGDTTYYTNALRELNWATYFVDFDGKNCFPTDEPWLTDGYGDYVRHYLRAMATYPFLAPVEDHILSSTSVIQQADYKGHFKKYLSVDFNNTDSNKVCVYYRAFDNFGAEEIKLKEKPSSVLLNDMPLKELTDGEGYSWVPVENGGGVLWIRRKNGNRVLILN